MATESEQTQANNNTNNNNNNLFSSLAGRTDIAKVMFRDGSSIRFPSIDSVASASSIHTTPSPFGSRSSSQRRGRPKASSFSSTSSARDHFGYLAMIRDIDDSSTDQTAIGHARPGSMSSNLRQDSDPLDYVSVGEEWDSRAHWLRANGGWATESGQDPSVYSQDQLVANVHGAGQDPPRHFDDMETTIRELMMQPDSVNYREVLPAGNSFGEFGGPSSAPPAPSWMRRSRNDSLSAAVASIISDPDHSFELDNAAQSRPARKPGRVPGSKLSEDKRRKVAIMRIIGACQYCKEGRRGCDPGTPCKPCIQHFGAEVLDKPNHCRRDIVESLTKEILSDKCKWHPYPRELSDFFGRDFLVTTWTTEIPIQFGFGPFLRRAVQIIETSAPSNLQHQHVNYSPPAQSSVPFPTHDFVLPVTFSDTSDLHIAIDNHLTLLVDEHFGQFTHFTSSFQVLHTVVKLFHHYRQTHHDYANLLRQALKLLVLIQSSEITVPTNDPSVSSILNRCAPGYPSSQNVSPCILRAELGKIVPQLAHFMLQDVLKKLFRICLVKRCDQHPIVIATFSVLMMTIESIMYQSARIGFHANTALGGPSRDPNRTHNPFASTTHPIESAAALQESEKAAQCLQKLYQNCFENCHALLLRIIEQRHYTSLQKSFGEMPAHFVASVNQAIRDANNYLQGKASEKVENVQEIGGLFDRLLARLFLLQTEPY